MRLAVPCLIVSGYADVEAIAPDLPRLARPFRAFALAEALGRMAGGGSEPGRPPPEPVRVAALTQKWPGLIPAG